MNNRRRGTALAGAAAAVAASGSVLTRHQMTTDVGDFWSGAVIGIAIGMLILALLLIRRDSACFPRSGSDSGEMGPW